MSTHHHDPAPAPAPAPDSDDRERLLATILAIGEARASDEARGGPLLAAFGDFCWGTGRAQSLALFDLWLAEVCPHSPSPADVARARVGLGGDR